MNKVFIHTNNKQLFGAILAKYALEKNSINKNAFSIEFINVDELEVFKNFRGKEYLRDGRAVKYDSNDLQSFTLSRFMPPELTNFQGRAIVIDPDIFNLSDINELFSLDMQGRSIAACRKKGAWDTSVMLMDCVRLKHWRIDDILKKLENKELDYSDLMTLNAEDQGTILEIPRIWNSLDELKENTKMLHTTNRLTQPWKTGLKIDFTRKKLPKILGIFPREPLLRLLGRYPMTYQPHPDKNIERFFFSLAREALKKGVITEELVNNEISRKHLRPDFFRVLESLNA
ncbi:MAG: glycosyltransferase [Patescibacteria group bacterium]